MHNYKSDMSHNDPNYEVEVYSRQPSRNVLGKITFWKNVGSWNVNGTCKIGNEKVDLPMSNLPISNLPNGQHQLLATTDSPTISACTTATNLSSMDVCQTFGSVTSYNRRLGTLEENLRVVQPEIEPLQTKKIEIVDIFKPTNGSAVLSINDDPKAKEPPKILATQVLTAVSVSIVSLVIGFVTAFTSPAAELLTKDLDISPDQYTWICSFMPLAALVGGLIGGQSIEYLGRKWTIALTDVMFVLSWILTAAATNVYFMYVARSIVGLSVGIASLALPVYLGETIQPEVRGTLGLLPTAFGNTGILLCFAAGSVLRWNKLAWLGIALPIPFLILMFFLPESPRWYISKGKDAKAKDALQWLRGKKSDVNEEYDDLVKAHVESEKMSSDSSISDFFCKANMKPLMIALGLMFFQQLSGINAVIFYTTTIFKMAGSTIEENVCTIIVGVVNFVSTFIATVLIDRLGRKVLLYISGASMAVTLISLGVYFYLKELKMNVAPYGSLPLVSAVIYVLGFSLGFGPVPWLMLGEILPAKIRGSAASLATSFNWACTFLVTKTFMDVINILGKHGTFWMFACVCIISLVFVFICVPETQGKSLQDIERKFVRRMSSIANLKTTPSSIS